MKCRQNKDICACFHVLFHVQKLNYAKTNKKKHLIACYEYENARNFYHQTEGTICKVFLPSNILKCLSKETLQLGSFNQNKDSRN